MWIFSLISLFSLTSALKPSVNEGVIIRGSTSPLPDFDPLGFTEKKDIAYLREAELKHGRWAMIGASTIPFIESQTHRPAIHEFQDLADYKQLLIVGLITAFEFQSMLKGWNLPWKEEFSLKEDYHPGDLGFNLFKDKESEETGLQMDKELNNGRLAMIGFMGIMVQELVTNRPIF